jgi:hypothetical protein
VSWLVPCVRPRSHGCRFLASTSPEHLPRINGHPQRVKFPRLPRVPQTILKRPRLDIAPQLESLVMDELAVGQRHPTIKVNSVPVARQR